MSNERERLTEYEQIALARGRPRFECRCYDCFCPLHAYGGKFAICVWCRNGRHYTGAKR